MRGTLLLRVLLYGGAVLDLLLLGKLWQLGLVRRYRMLSIYLVFSFFRSVASVYLRQTGTRLFGFNGYAFLYVYTQPLLWALFFLLILELYSLILEDFPGIRSLGRWVMFSGLGAATLAGCALMLLDRQAGFFHYPFFAALALRERSVFLCLGALTALLVSFISHFRLPVARNLLVLCASFGGYFILNAQLSILVHYFGDTFVSLRNVLNSSFFFAALLGATVFLSKAGEMEARQISAPWAEQNRELELALLSQLQGFNEVLAGVFRR